MTTPARHTEPGAGVRVTEAEADAMHSAAVCGFTALLSADEFATVQALVRRGLIARTYTGAAGLLGVSMLSITEQGHAALSAPRILPEAAD